MFKRILVPTDGSELSEIASGKTIEIAKAVGAGVVGSHAISRPPSRAGEVGFTSILEIEPTGAGVEAERTARKYL